MERYDLAAPRGLPTDEYENCRYILHGLKDVAGQANAAQNAIEYVRQNGLPSGGLMGSRVNGRYYSIKFGRGSVSVWINE